MDKSLNTHISYKNPLHIPLNIEGKEIIAPSSSIRQTQDRNELSIKKSLENTDSLLNQARAITKKENCIRFLNENFIENRTIDASLFKDFYTLFKQSTSFRFNDIFIIKKLSKSLEKDSMLMSIIEDNKVWPKDFMDGDYKTWVKAISDDTMKDEAYCIIGLHADTPIPIKIKIAKKIKDLDIKTNYIQSILDKSIPYAEAINLAQALNDQENQDLAYFTISKGDYKDQDILSAIQFIQNPLVKKNACFEILNNDLLPVKLKLEVINLIPNELHTQDDKDKLYLAIAINPALIPWDRYQAFKYIQSNSLRIRILEVFDKEPDIQPYILAEATSSGPLSRLLLEFYFFNRPNGINLSFQNLLNIASKLNKSEKYLSAEYPAKVSYQDRAFISLSLDASFSLEERFIAFKNIQSLNAKVEIQALRSLLKTYLLNNTSTETSRLNSFELLSKKEFSSDIALLVLPNCEDVKALYKQVQSYHRIPKGVASNFASRIQALDRIVSFINSILESLASEQDSTSPLIRDKQIQSLTQISIQAKNKVNYLKKIPKLKEKAIARVDPSADPKHNLPPETPILNVLGNKGRNLDPLKRKGLSHFREIWSGLVKNNPNTPNFWIWLDAQDVSTLTQDSRYTLYKTSDKKVEFEGGLAHNKTFGNQNGHLLEGNYIYNIGQDGHLYILPYLTPKNEKFTHDTILKGKNILSAGIVEFKEGKIIYIDVDSGHYTPHQTYHLKHALNHFLEKNPNTLHPDTEIGDYAASKKPICTYKEFLETSADVALEREAVTLEQLGFKSKKSS